MTMWEKVLQISENKLDWITYFPIKNTFKKLNKAHGFNPLCIKAIKLFSV